jgi:hypothetical protein
MPTAKERLVAALRGHSAPRKMIDAALEGRYDDFESNSATPIMDLVRDCQVEGLNQIAIRAMNGDFDA